MLEPKLNKIYYSFKMYHPDGTFMCQVDKKRANWYVNRQLAEWMTPSQNEFKLKFAPTGYGKANIEYYQQTMQERCVCCGVDGEQEGMTRHHVVPYVFRSRFPKEYKESNHFDILPLCVECHEDYELHASAFKQTLLDQYGASVSYKVSPEARYNKKIINSISTLDKEKKGLLLNKSGEPGAISEPRRAQLMEWAAKELLNDPGVEITDGWSQIIEKVIEQNKLFDFIKLWRMHFLDNAKPQFLPNNWVIDHPIENTGPSEKPLAGKNKLF